MILVNFMDWNIYDTVHIHTEMVKASNKRNVSYYRI